MYNVSYLNLPYDIYTVIYSFLFYRELLILIFISKESKKLYLNQYIGVILQKNIT